MVVLAREWLRADFGLVPGTTAVGWELTLAPRHWLWGDRDCRPPRRWRLGVWRDTPARRAVRLGSGGCGSCQGRQPLQGMIQSRSAGQQLSRGEVQTAPPQAGAGGWEQGWGTRQDAGWHSSTGGKAPPEHQLCRRSTRHLGGAVGSGVGPVVLELAQGLHQSPQNPRAPGRAGPHRVAANHPQVFLPGVSRAVACGAIRLRLLPSLQVRCYLAGLCIVSQREGFGKTEKRKCKFFPLFSFFC